MTGIAVQPRLEVADILRAHGDAYRAHHPVSPEQATVLRRLSVCRTAALGGHVDSCDACGTVRVSYNSCRDRHCPKCQTRRQIEWVESRLARLLPVPYFHVVFTLPEQLQPLGLKNRRVLYSLLFRTASETLMELATDPRRLGAQLGVTAVLHTWGQNLLFHPHLHCVVTDGGLSPDGQRWVTGREDYFLPVRVLGHLFRGKFLAGLKAAYQAGQLTLAGSVEELRNPAQFRQLLGTLYRQRWVVYAKPGDAGGRPGRWCGRYGRNDSALWWLVRSCGVAVWRVCRLADCCPRHARRVWPSRGAAEPPDRPAHPWHSRPHRTRLQGRLCERYQTSTRRAATRQAQRHATDGALRGRAERRNRQLRNTGLDNSATEADTTVVKSQLADLGPTR
jgi:hypothetical protein